MKPIKYLLLFATALCVSNWRRWGREPQRGFGPRTPNNPRFQNSIGLDPRFRNRKYGTIQQNQNTYLQPQENQLNLNTQPEQAPEAEVQVFGSMYFNGEHLQLPEQQLQALFNPLFEQLVKIEQKLNNDEQLTEQQIFNLLMLMPDLADLQPIFKELTDLVQKPQEVQKQQFQQAFQQLKEVQSQVGESL
jgi:hypothetical protein